MGNQAIPARGAIFDMSNMIEPHKIGGVMWAREPVTRLMAPLDLHSLSLEDLNGLNRVYCQLRDYRKVTPALHVVNSVEWQDRQAIKPYLMASMVGRTEARALQASDDWDQFWNAFD